MHSGWHQVGFERELASALTPVSIGPRRLVVVHRGDEWSVYDAICPHRGAHLGYGGQLDGDSIVCPFHGHRIALGCDRPAPFCVRGYRTLSAGGALFVLLADHLDHGFAQLMADLDRTHFIAPGFSLRAKTTPEVVMENAFDRRHFTHVHGIDNLPDLRVREGASGELIVTSVFLTRGGSPAPAGSVNDRRVETRFTCRLFSPGLCVTELQDYTASSIVISAATPTEDGTCVIRVTVAAPPDANGKPPSHESIAALLRDSRKSYEEDLAIWEHLSPDASFELLAEDQGIADFHRYCAHFDAGPQ